MIHKYNDYDNAVKGPDSICMAHDYPDLDLPEVGSNDRHAGGIEKEALVELWVTECR